MSGGNYLFASGPEYTCFFLYSIEKSILFSYCCLPVAMGPMLLDAVASYMILGRHHMHRNMVCGDFFGL